MKIAAAPRMLQCGHSVCTQCAERVTQRCPVCQRPFIQLPNRQLTGAQCSTVNYDLEAVVDSIVDDGADYENDTVIRAPTLADPDLYKYHRVSVCMLSD